MQNRENTLLDYHKIELEARARAKQTKSEYVAEVSPASWLKLDIDGAVLLTPTEFSQLPQLSQEFFLDGNVSHYRTDRVAMRGERIILLDGYYSGGPKGELRADYFLEVAQSFRKAVPEVLEELSDNQEGQWKAKLAVWDNLISLGVAQFHALKAITLLSDHTLEQKRLITNKSQQLMSDMFDGYFLQLCGQPTSHLAAMCFDDISAMISLVSAHQQEFKTWGEYDLFRTEREVVGAQAFMAAYSWIKEGLLDEVEEVIGPLIGSIDVIESLRFLAKFREEFNLPNYKLPQRHIYILPKISPIGRSSRSMGERSGTIPLYDGQTYEIIPMEQDTTVAFVDDTAFTMTSLKELKAFVLNQRKVTDKETLVASVGTRWAVNDLSPAQELGDLKAVGISPTMKTFKGRFQGIETLLSRYRVRQRLDVSRRVENADQIIDFLRKAAYWETVDGVGFDLFGTLIGDKFYDREGRRHELHAKFLEKIREWNPKITESQFQEVYWNTRNQLEMLTQENEGVYGEFQDQDLWSRLVSIFGISDSEEKARILLSIELDHELQKYSVIPGMLQVVREAITLFGAEHVGIFSNSRLSSENVHQLLRNYGFIGEKGMLIADNIVTSSDLGVRKPDAKTLQYLAQKLGVLNRRFMFIGDSKEDMLATSRTKSVGVQLIT